MLNLKNVLLLWKNVLDRKTIVCYDAITIE